MKLPLLMRAACLAAGCAVGADVGSAGGLALAGWASILAVIVLSRPEARGCRVALGAAAVAVGAAGAGAERLADERQPLGQWLRQRGGYLDRPVAIEGIARGDGQEWPDRTTVGLDALEGRGPFDALPPGGRRRGA